MLLNYRQPMYCEIYEINSPWHFQVYSGKSHRENIDVESPYVIGAPVQLC